MKKIILLAIIAALSLSAEDLKVKAKIFNSDQKKGISIFEGDVNIIKGADELNASKVTIYTDKEQNPTKFVAEGNASFHIVTQEGAAYRGKAQKVIYLPTKKEYHFFTDVYLQQLNEKKEIIGEEVILKSIEGKAYAKGDKEKPVIMIFDLPEKKKKKEKEDKK